ECSGHAEREEQRADLHLQVVREDREQLAKAAALAATPDTTGEATAGSQDACDLGERKLHRGRVHETEDAGGCLEQVIPHAELLHRMSLEANIRPASCRGGGHLDVAIADVYPEHEAALARALGGKQRGGARSSGNVDHPVSEEDSGTLDAADRVFAQNRRPHAIVDVRGQVPALAHHLPVLLVREFHATVGARFEVAGPLARIWRYQPMQG